MKTSLHPPRRTRLRPRHPDRKRLAGSRAPRPAHRPAGRPAVLRLSPGPGPGHRPAHPAKSGADRRHPGLAAGIHRPGPQAQPPGPGQHRLGLAAPGLDPPTSGFFSDRAWSQNEAMAAGGVGAVYDSVIRSFDALLAQYGYQRQGRLYRAVAPNKRHPCLFLPLCPGVRPAQPASSTFPPWFCGTACAPRPSSVHHRRHRGAPPTAPPISVSCSSGTSPTCTPTASRLPSMARFCECYGNPGEIADD